MRRQRGRGIGGRVAQPDDEAVGLLRIDRRLRDERTGATSEPARLGVGNGAGERGGESEDEESVHG